MKTNHELHPEYKLTVGIECHVQFKTKSKLFSGADNDAREAESNTLVNHIDFGLPGALPVLNKEAINLAIKAGYALNSRAQAFSKFDRKHYFYPDLPMGYQITQFDEPIIIGGYVEFYLDGELKRINLTRAHLEADAGKSIHPGGTDYSLVDLNRAGTPLLEIVSEPEIHTPAEARGYASELYMLMRYADVSDANLFYGNMRFDVNVSVSTTEELGTRTETKNLNSFRAVEKTVEYELNRQIGCLEDGEKIIQETRGWDDSKNQTYSMRSKENADDYRYMPDPDLPPVILSDEYIDNVLKSMPKMPGYWRQQLTKLGLDESIADSIILAEVEYLTKNLEYVIAKSEAGAKALANLIVNIEIPLRRQQEESKQPNISLSDADRHKLYDTVSSLISDNKLSSNTAKDLILKLLVASELPDDIEKYASSEGLIQNSNQDEILLAVQKVIADNPKAAEDVRSGEMKAIGFLVGSVMKLTGGKANPGLVNQLIKSELGLS
ncbi:MAG TPA: Asp-tRNA(Asn)/Glu-tRNA(Gln) amidotransferase subunit GatB [Candidatus Saccharimonadales bacterium]